MDWISIWGENWLPRISHYMASSNLILTFLCCSQVSRDGRYGLYAPARGGLELLELRHGTSVRTLIPRVAEGVFSVICLFTRTDEYVLYYHGGRKTIRVFR